MISVYKFVCDVDNVVVGTCGANITFSDGRSSPSGGGDATSGGGDTTSGGGDTTSCSDGKFILVNSDDDAVEGDTLLMSFFISSILDSILSTSFGGDAFKYFMISSSNIFVSFSGFSGVGNIRQDPFTHV